MSNKKISIIYLFFFIIPYVLCLSIIGVSYNSLVLHALTWRIVVGGFVGAFGMFAVKVIAQRPVLIMYRSSTRKILKDLLHFFVLERNKVVIGANLFVDFWLSMLSIYLIARFLPLSLILGRTMGWLVFLLMISLTLASYLEFESLSIYTEKKK
ncbi:hypothetical protein [Companilactobacillus kimchii]|uniref:Uncharacterized protein n=1 Tax=Companilactobacillus kimchii TaxID=2801452 RepID=A0A210P7R2_9LACO|nr:hypothetical protein [Companilactobacillus kimchii]KAE9559365.1 hypothetical protein ATN91_12045 [Companilactobacillus kimchii]OWF32518.1 hypothetical protein LKACC12383_02039 [Companilactobacillus kimchii]GEO47482.1 hypothetical protein LKI01_14810 [Companilactobacillus paralimentarius]